MIESIDDFDRAKIVIFPGVGNFAHAAEYLHASGMGAALTAYIRRGGAYLGICIGMQVLFEASEEAPGVKGLGIIPGKVKKLTASKGFSVPHMGWNQIRATVDSPLIDELAHSDVYFVHSFAADYFDASTDRSWIGGVTRHGSNLAVSVVAKDRVFATQFHPEKSGAAGGKFIGDYVRAILSNTPVLRTQERTAVFASADQVSTGLVKRIIACLDVRSNDQGDLVVTKGDQYNVREESGAKDVRNLGKPVELAERYYREGADEITFLNITSYRNCPLRDLPLLSMIELASEKIFVPLCIGGGIKDTVDTEGVKTSALDIATAYFASGADKVSIGSDAVEVALQYIASGGQKTGTSSIETISRRYGAQAVVISIDPRRVYVADPSETKHHAVQAVAPGPNGEKFCWYKLTSQGGRHTHTELDVVDLAVACEDLGAGEILLNCIDQDGTGLGFDTALISLVASSVSIPVIGSSGAGHPRHFSELFEKTGCDAGLAAGIFHRNEVLIDDVKRELEANHIPARRAPAP